MKVKEFRKYAEAAQYLKKIKNSGFKAFLQKFYDEKGVFYHVVIYDIWISGKLSKGLRPLFL